MFDKFANSFLRIKADRLAGRIRQCEPSPFIAVQLTICMKGSLGQQS